MLIPLIKSTEPPKQDKEKAPVSKSSTGASPIKVDLGQTKPKRKAATKSSSKKEKIVVDNTAELRETINRIFADEDAILITTQEELLDFLRQQEVFGLDTETSEALNRIVTGCHENEVQRIDTEIEKCSACKLRLCDPVLVKDLVAEIRGY